MRQLLAAATVAICALALAACGGGTTTVTVPAGETTEESTVPGVHTVDMTRQQWDAVELGWTKKQVIEQVGKPTDDSTSGDLTSLFYSLTESGEKTVAFALVKNRLVSKTWMETSFTEGTISAAKYAKAADGMSEAEVEKALGPPFERRDEYTSYSEPAMGQNPPGTLQRCFIYQPRNEKFSGAYEVCFGTEGRVNWTYP
jgi:hypothetical protein